MSSSPPRVVSPKFPKLSPPQLSPKSLQTGSDSSTYFTPPRLDPIIEHVKAEHTQHIPHQRARSVSSVAFRGGSRVSQSPLGHKKAKSLSRGREVSPPPPCRFQHHVSFDNFAGGEPTEKNTISFTLNVKHKGYQFKRRSRTFMVGIDENSYSDIALQWMLEELVDDGDEIICLRVLDKDSKIISDRSLERKQYQKDARELMVAIQKKNDENRAISIILEFAVGKVHATFQKMIQIYQPAMLIVGTRGRSLGGFQGLVKSRNSFSKWCLQYSPIPVVVVRPTEKRMKKKLKRDADPGRQDYARILKDSGITDHEMDTGSTNNIFEVGNDADAEAHAVAAALELPAQFDPTLKPYGAPLRKIDSQKSEMTIESSPPDSPERVLKSPLSDMGDSDNDESEDEGEGEDEGEFDVVAGHTLLGNDTDRPEIVKKQKLHAMEVGEAKALAAGRKNSIGSVDSGSPPRTEEVSTADNEDEDDEE